MTAMKPKMLLVLIGAALAVWQACSGSAFLSPVTESHRPSAPPRRLGNGFGPGYAPITSGRSAKVLRKSSGSESEKSTNLLREGALFSGYFCAQTGMAFLMKLVLSKAKVAKDLFGVPASFFVIGTQQLVSFSIMLTILLVSRLIRRPYEIKKLKRSQIVLVMVLSLSFSLNTGFNLLAMSLIPLSLLMIIRACSPLSTSFMQTMILKDKSGQVSLAEWACLAAGVICAAVVTLCESGGGGIMGAAASRSFWFGVICAVTSVLLAGLDFVIKAKMGKLNFGALDTNFYNALPVVAITLLVGSLLPTPVPVTWAKRFGSPLTDLAVFRHLFEVNPGIFKLVAASGIAAFGFNLYVTFLVVKLSPATSSFAGNFNKSVGILLALIFLEGNRPHNLRGYIKLCAVFGNILAFTAYNMIKKRKKEKQKEKAKEKEETDDEEKK